jgi:hypothetical protein
MITPFVYMCMYMCVCMCGKAVTQWKANVSPVQIWFVRVFFAATIGFQIPFTEM